MLVTTKLSKNLKQIIQALELKYPKPECALIHDGPWQLLVATILSAQCTDKRVNMVTPALFKKFASVKSFADAEIEEVEEAVRSTGFFRNKARNIVACAKALLENHAGKVPQRLSELVKLPGVGRKTASVILGTAFAKAEGIVVDTHVKRLSLRMGLTTATDPEKVELELMKIVPKSKWINFSHLLILHGRERCGARKPDCTNCEINSVCPRIGIGAGK